MITAEFDTRSIERGLDNLARRAERARPFFDQLKGPLREDQRDHRRSKEGPDRKWPDRAQQTPSSKGKKRKRRSKRLLGKLTTAVGYRASSVAVTARSKIPWSGIHQEGSEAGQGAKIPARPFLWLSADFVQDAGEALLTYVTRDWGRGR